MDPKPYLDYLDKEMTIMGLLSGFSLALAALAVDRIASAGVGVLAMMWPASGDLILAGSGTALLSAFWFYRQRSLLASYVGQITLAQLKSNQHVESLLVEADGWDTWVNYQRGFAYLFIAFVPYSLAFIRTVWPGVSAWSWTITGVVFVMTALTFELRAHLLKTYPQSDDPFAEWRKGR
jgi:hypothetical protein